MERFGETTDNELEPPKPDFDFTAQEVLETLRPAAEHTRIEYIGSASSHFQSEPVMYDAEGNLLPPVSDWELELQKNLEGKSSGIKDQQDINHFPRFLPNKEKYIDRSAELGENMFRFSLDFARLCPKEGEFDSALMAEYVKALALVRAHGQEPMLTMHHFTMPRYLLETDNNDNITQGGWENPEVSKHFRFYVENVVKYLGDEDKVRKVLASEKFDKPAQDKLLSEGLAKYFLAINEPMSTLSGSYIAGTFPPYRRGGVLTAKKVLERMIESYDITRDEIKTLGSKLPSERAPQVGIGHNWQYFDGIFSGLANEFGNEYVTDKFERDGAKSDFLGLHYYCRLVLPFIHGDKKGRDYSDHPTFGDVYPPGILEVLKKMNASYPNKEIFISEIGFADKADQRKPYWLLETMRYIIEAKKEGLPIKGILLWSLVNNFEWELGMNNAKFGLFSEKELSEPLVPSKNGVRSWEAWQSSIKAITNPSLESLQELQTYYSKAYKQYYEYKVNIEK
ncbi:MAG: hypothetical protein A2588_02460 [Candidatus Veblenbacteria bacterium RIFOXYD1_FULL_43_11]|uniref:Glycoside hydrolase family 1 n=1 Tax=Candidatus Veblenbacteria bacterium RIFOXYD1_FULL_43_11 TaxID=1802429 RepID=A0A1G2Q9R9_9BACT|nr:MAG: hypothetical protein A2588_02460 [Candidatus Veblenbacteria bacterium RIFOXYD1_FULL_43_11]